MRFATVIAGALMTAATSASAQEISAAVEARRDRLDYHFTNASSFDTATPVAHYFEQHYVADNLWLVVSAQYRARWRTTVGVTPRRGTSATDYDTFFDPGGPTWVSGATGPADMRSWEIEQAVRLAASPTGGGVRHAVQVGYRLRHDAADFGIGHATIVRDGTLVSASDVSSRETTSSQLHEVFGAIGVEGPIGPAWTMSGRGEVAPLAVGRLAVQLPDKYPGQNLVFVAKGFAASGGIGVARRLGRWTVEVDARAERTWSYGSSDRVGLTSVAGAIVTRRRW